MQKQQEIRKSLEDSIKNDQNNKRFKPNLERFDKSPQIKMRKEAKNKSN
jgi:hypothetical protein